MKYDETIPDPPHAQDELYQEAITLFGGPLGRLARAYESNTESCRDLLQEIHIAVWRSLAGFDRRCSLRTWVYRVAHNTATSHVIRDRRSRSKEFVTLETLEVLADKTDVECAASHHLIMERVMQLVQKLNPIDRQVMLLYLEGVDAAGIGEVTGISPGNVSTKIHRIKKILVQQFHQGGSREQ